MMAKDPKDNNYNYKKEIISVNEDIDLFLLVGESVETPLWEECEDETHTPEMGTWESTGTPKTSEFHLRGQNTSHWGVIYITGKLPKCKYWN